MQINSLTKHWPEWFSNSLQGLKCDRFHAKQWYHCHRLQSGKKHMPGARIDQHPWPLNTANAAATLALRQTDFVLTAPLINLRRPSRPIVDRSQNTLALTVAISHFYLFRIGLQGHTSLDSHSQTSSSLLSSSLFLLPTYWASFKWHTPLKACVDTESQRTTLSSWLSAAPWSRADSSSNTDTCHSFAGWKLHRPTC